MTAPAGKEADYRIFEEWVDYYKAKKVKAIHAGFLTMRRRVRAKLGAFRTGSFRASLSLGDAILRRFAVRDQPLSDEQLLNSKLQVEQESSCGRSWNSATNSGWPRRHNWLKPPGSY